jgi:hypothetical protein
LCSELSRISPSAARPEPATSIARALNQRLPEKISGAGTLYLWLRAVERIEEEEELGWVRDHGADFVQGFLRGHPSAEVRA